MGLDEEQLQQRSQTVLLQPHFSAGWESRRAAAMGTCPLSVPITWAWHQRPLPACRGEVTAAFVLGSLGPPQKNLFYFYFYFPRPAGSSSVLLSASSEPLYLCTCLICRAQSRADPCPSGAPPAAPSSPRAPISPSRVMLSDKTPTPGASGEREAKLGLPPFKGLGWSCGSRWCELPESRDEAALNSQLSVIKTGLVYFFGCQGASLPFERGAGPWCLPGSQGLGGNSGHLQEVLGFKIDQGSVCWALSTPGSLSRLGMGALPGVPPREEGIPLFFV